MEQIFIAITSIAAIYLSQQRDERLKSFACIFGLIGQPFWFYTTYTHEQWGIFAMCFVYTYCWLMGVWNNWIAK